MTQINPEIDIAMNLNFLPIQISEQEKYTARLSQCPQVASEYSFLNLWAWAQDYGLLWAWDENLVWIKQTQPEIRFWAPVGAWESVDWETVFDENLSAETIFVRVPQKLNDLWSKCMNGRLTVFEERGQWDYLYEISDLIDLKGNRYHKKKNLVNQFKKKYEFSYTPLVSGLVEHAIGMQSDWCAWRDCESSEILSAENRAIYKILEDWERLDGAIGGALMVNQQMVAYTVAEELTEDTVLIHFEKGDTEYKGVYQTINQMFLAHSAQDFIYVNREQDLNDEGLRKAKLSYKPVDFLRKYRVVLPG
jgi:hypothetical protein